MKTIINLFIGILITISLAAASQTGTSESKSILIQSTDKNAPVAKLQQSADIISSRLKTFGLSSFDVSIVPGKAQLKIQLPDDQQLSEIEGLLISRGDLAFYKTSPDKEKLLLSRTDIENIHSSQDKDSKSYLIEIKFRPAVTGIWAKATRENMNKPIEIVIDNKVFYNPVVKAVMESGLCEISGNMTLKEANYFIALVKNEQLPLNFSLIK